MTHSRKEDIAVSDEQTTRRVGVATAREDTILMSVRHAAGLLSISERSLWSLIQRGEIPVVTLGGRVLIARADLEALAASSLRRGQ